MFIDIRSLSWYNFQVLYIHVCVFLSKENHKDDTIFIETVAPFLTRFHLNVG